MQNKTNSNLKTLGAPAANLIVTLYESNREMFNYDDVQEVTGLSDASARSFIRHLVNRGVVMRLTGGLFRIIPYSMGSVTEYVGNEYILARELNHSNKYYISYASAMDIHGMLTQPQFIVYISSTKKRRTKTVQGIEFKFVYCKKDYLFGIAEHWIDKHEQVKVSDLERTIIDGLKRPQYCGGFTEVAKGFHIRKDDMNPTRLVEYALKLGNNAVVKRLGFMLEQFEWCQKELLEVLHLHVQNDYVLLDPTFSDEGKYLSRWKLRINIEPDEILTLLDN